MIVFFDCFAGISGDMALGALIDAGVSFDDILLGLRTLPLPDWDIEIRRVRKGAIAATSVTVQVRGDRSHRSLADIEHLIMASRLPEKVKAQSLHVFRLLAEAEATVHGIRVNDVHFHEVGAVDAIVDIVGTVYALHLLGVETVYASSLPFSRGRIQGSHGEFPVPAPATAELLCGVPTYPLDIEGELVTPTGAALLKGLAKGFGLPPPFTPHRIGYGAGKRDFPFPNILRVFLGEPKERVLLGRERLLVVETNLDDMNPEVAGHVMDRLFSVGAKDVWFVPVQMKKNRPGILISVLCDRAVMAKVLEALFQETTTLGVRVTEVERFCVGRETWEVETPYGRVRVKVARLGESILNFAPEYEDCRRLALEKGVPLKEVMASAMEAARRRV